MFLERNSLKRLSRFLIFGTGITAAAGLVMLLFPDAVARQIGVAGASPFFVALSGLLIGLLGVAYTLTLLDREPNKGLLILGFFEKLFVSVLIVYETLLQGLPLSLYAVAIFDFTMAILFGIYVKGYRTDDWM